MREQEEVSRTILTTSFLYTLLFCNYLGDYCNMPNGRQGQCKRFIKCRPARYDFKVNNVGPVSCGEGTQLICCDDLGTRARTQAVTPPPLAPKIEIPTGYGWKSQKSK